MNQAFSKIGIIVIVIIFIVGIVLAWQHFGSAWKTYSNKEYEFSMQYPKDWMSQEIRQEKGPEKETFAFIRFYPKDEIWVYRIEKIGQFTPVTTSIFNGSSKDYLSTIPTESIKSKEEITINNISATKIKIVAMKEVYQYIFDIPTKGSCIVISDQVSEFAEKLKIYFEITQISEEENFQSIFDQMLSTFRFTE